jgi:hypothetical protein
MSRRSSRIAPITDAILRPDCGGDLFGSSAAQFLRTLSPGINVVLQYDCAPPAFGTFQGFQGGNVILTNFNGFPGLVRIAANRVNAVSPFSGFGGFGTGFFGGGSLLGPSLGVGGAV